VFTYSPVESFRPLMLAKVVMHEKQLWMNHLLSETHFQPRLLDVPMSKSQGCEQLAPKVATAVLRLASELVTYRSPDRCRTVAQ